MSKMETDGGRGREGPRVARCGPRNASEETRMTRAQAIVVRLGPSLPALASTRLARTSGRVSVSREPGV
jgi:hypothetical protein